MDGRGRTDHERMLTALHEATRALMTKDTKEEICTVAVNTARTVLDLPITGIHLLDDDTRRLEPVASTSEAKELLGSIPTYEEGEGLSGRVFEEGTARLYRDVRDEPERYNRETPIRTEIIAPLGEYGVLTTGSTAPTEFTEYDLDLLKILAANAEAALDRVDRQEVLYRRRRITDAVGDGVYQLDGDGYLVTVNETIVEKTGYSREELLGSHVSSILDDEAISRCVAVIHELFESESEDVGTTDIDIETADGERISCEVRIALLENGADGDAYGTVGVLRDITERKRRERELEYHRDELSRLDRINAVIRDINQSLVEADTRTEVEQAVCDRIAASDAYLFTWIGEPDYARQELVPRASAGAIDDYLEAVTVRLDDDPYGRGPGGTAVRSGEVQVVQDIHSNEAFEPLLETVAEYGYESVASIPIPYGRNLYSVLCVYSDRPHAFDADEQAVLKELGETIGLAISAREQRRALLSESLTEVEFRLSDTLRPLVEATENGTCTIDFERTISIDDGYVQYVTVDGLAPRRFRDALVQVEDIDDTRTVGRAGEKYLFEVSIDELPLQEAIEPYGGSVSTMTIENGELRFTVELPTSADTRRVTDAIAAVFPDADLLAQRTVARKPDSVVEYRSVLGGRLTEKQRTALELAYFSGHYDWPRRTTGEEVADVLGISPATFAQHLRAAEQKTFEAILTDDTSA